MSFTEIIALFLAASLPTVATIAIVELIARPRTETFLVTVAVFLTGAFVIAPAAFLIELNFRVTAQAAFGTTIGQGLLVLMAAPVTEEVLKWIILWIVTQVRPVRNLRRLVILGAAVGAGFATAENFLYFYNSQQVWAGNRWLDFVIPRVMGTASMHILAGMVLGFFCTCAVRGRARFWGTIGITIAVFGHSLWNLIALGINEFEMNALLILPGIVMWTGVFGGLLLSLLSPESGED